MKHKELSIAASLLSILLVSFHLSDDIVRGFEKGGLSNLNIIPILVVWLLGAVVLAGRRWGYVITLVLSLLSTGVPFIHFDGPVGVMGRRVAHTSGAMFFVWTLLALGVTGLFGFLLSAYGLWRSFRSPASS